MGNQFSARTQDKLLSALVQKVANVYKVILSEKHIKLVLSAF